MTTNTSSAKAEGLPEIPPMSDARDLLTRIKDLNELVLMAADGMLGISSGAANAIAAGCDEIAKKLDQVCDIIDAQEGGAA